MLSVEKQYIEQLLNLTVGIPIDLEASKIYDKILKQSLEYFNKKYLKYSVPELLNKIKEVNKPKLTQFIESNVEFPDEIEHTTKCAIAKIAIAKITDGKVNIPLEKFLELRNKCIH